MDRLAIDGAAASPDNPGNRADPLMSSRSSLRSAGGHAGHRARSAQTGIRGGSLAVWHWMAA